MADFAASILAPGLVYAAQAPHPVTIVGGVAVASDAQAPEVTNFQPPVGADIGPDTTLQFDVTDAGSLAAVVIAVVGPVGADHPEVAYSLGAFRGEYVNPQSTVHGIANGYRFTLRRTGGWRDADGQPVAPTIEYVTVDTGGNLGEVS